jgi:hypothetical protein
MKVHRFRLNRSRVGLKLSQKNHDGRRQAEEKTEDGELGYSPMATKRSRVERSRRGHLFLKEGALKSQRCEV